jgi:hypothetical protein
VDTVALAATIGGSIVALAGVGATVWSTWQQRLSSRELANSQHEHERALASGARLFEKRGEVYESMLQLLTTAKEGLEEAAARLQLGEIPRTIEIPSRRKPRVSRAFRRWAVLGSNQ